MAFLRFASSFPLFPDEWRSPFFFFPNRVSKNGTVFFPFFQAGRMVLSLPQYGIGLSAPVGLLITPVLAVEPDVSNFPLFHNTDLKHIFVRFRTQFPFPRLIPCKKKCVFPYAFGKEGLFRLTKMAATPSPQSFFFSLFKHPERTFIVQTIRKYGRPFLSTFPGWDSPFFPLFFALLATMAWPITFSRRGH